MGDRRISKEEVGIFSLVTERQEEFTEQTVVSKEQEQTSVTIK